jgi:hypothetical protein
MSKAFTLCCTLDEAKAVREEVAFFQAVKVLLTKRDIVAKKRSDEEREQAIRQIIGSAVVSEQVVDIFDAVGLDKPNIGILDDDFLAEVRNLPERNLAVELLERLLEGEIKSRFGGNVVQDKKFSELLSNVIKRYQNRSIETAQVIEELIEMAKKFREAANRGEVLGLSEDELRFYDALANNESSVRRTGRRNPEKNRPRTHRKPAPERQCRLVGARKRAGETAADGEAHPAQIQISARPTGRSGATGIAAGRAVEFGVGLTTHLACEIKLQQNWPHCKLKTPAWLRCWNHTALSGACSLSQSKPLKKEKRHACPHQKRLPYFVDCFVAARMCTQSGGKAKQQARVAMLRPAPTSGAAAFVGSPESNVVIATTAC